MSSKKIIKWCFLILWMVIIFLFSAQAYSNDATEGVIEKVLSDFVSSGMIGYVNFFVRKFAHVFEYFVLTMLLYFVILEYPKMYRYIYYCCLLFCFIYSLTDEIHQFFVPGRSAVFWDCVIDTCGGLIFVLLVYFGKKKKAIVD